MSNQFGAKGSVTDLKDTKGSNRLGGSNAFQQCVNYKPKGSTFDATHLEKFLSEAKTERNFKLGPYITSNNFNFLYI